MTTHNATTEIVSLMRFQDASMSFLHSLDDLRKTSISPEKKRGVNSLLLKIRDKIDGHIKPAVEAKPGRSVFCLEILGESSCHQHLVQQGWSGRSYVFRYNPPTNSYVRAYHRIHDYRAERVDIRENNSGWCLVANLLPENQIDEIVYAKPFANGK